MIYKCFAVFFIALLLLIALAWGGVINLQGPLVLVITALGTVCFSCVIAFCYGAFAPRSIKTAEPKPTFDDAQVIKQEKRLPDNQKSSGGTAVLFPELIGEQQDYDATALVERKQGLRLSWEIDGKVHCEESNNFPIIIGRDMSCHITINAQSVSRRHAQLTHDNNEYQITDMGSSNGTILNGKRIESTAVIDQGDEITLGRVNVRIDYT